MKSDLPTADGSPGGSSVQCFHWRIQPQLGSYLSSPALVAHAHEFEEMIKGLIPKDLCFEDERDFLQWIQESFPIIDWIIPEEAPNELSLFLLCSTSKLYRTDRLLLELLKSYVSNEKEVELLSHKHLYFHFSHLPRESFLAMQIQVLIEDPIQLNFFKNNVLMLTQEIKQAVQTPHRTRAYLEAKGLSEDFKMALVFKDLSILVKRFPHLFDAAIFTELRRLLALSTKEFLESRSTRHLAKVLGAHHIMRKTIARAVALFPQERHLQVRLAQTRLHFLFGTKSVIGLMIGICLRDLYELFDEKHILLAVQKIIPTAQVIKGSYYVYQSPQDMIRTLYLEIDKSSGDPVSLDERRALKKLLPHELKASVEKLMPAVFMMRNEEEIMKNIFILSHELKYPTDLPQVMITLEQQSGSDLVFTVVLVRLLRKHSKSLENLFRQIKTDAELTIDRIQIVGYLQKKYPKEATTFRLRIHKGSALLRADSSVNFYLARERVMQVINAAIGEVRDYNGGMILQQAEQLTELKQAFHEIALKQPDLLEDFFYSLTPIEIQATLPLKQLCALFHLLLQAISEELSKRESIILKVDQKKENISLIIRAREASYREQVQHSLSAIEISPKSLCSTHLDTQGSFCSGFIYECRDAEEQHKFLEAIQEAIRSWQKKVLTQQVLRLSYVHFPISLDPRIGGDEDSERFIKQLFEGLMRVESDGKPTCALAKSYEISPDKRCYTFKLRDSVWTNGDRVIAYDFEYAWKKILSPSFITPVAYLFYPIKNAKAAKEGRMSIDAVGVRALDDHTLVVELENPAPYFLELTTFTLFSPVNHRIDKIHPNWANDEGKGYVCNGPFQLKKRSIARGYELIKNPFYWNVQRVFLDQVLITQNNTYTALQMFNNNEIDWLGPPLSPWDLSFVKGSPEAVECCPSPRIFWYVFNVKRFPFDNKKLRQAFAAAIDRELMIKALHVESSKAVTPLPPGITQLSDPELEDNNKRRALELFEEALSELCLTRQEFPIITLIQSAGNVIRDKTAELIIEQWHALFGIRFRIESYDWMIIFDKMTQGDYQIGGMNWKSWINDPIYTLNAFRYASERGNFAKWEDLRYQKLLDGADKETDAALRLSLLKEAEEILLREMPLIPIYYEMHLFKRKSRLKVPVNALTGHVDFSYASIAPT